MNYFPQRPRPYPSYTKNPTHHQPPSPPNASTTEPSSTVPFSLRPLTLYDTPNSGSKLPASHCYTVSLQNAIIDACKGHTPFQRLREMLAAAQLAGIDVANLKAAEDDSLAREILQDTLDQARRSLVD